MVEKDNKKELIYTCRGTISFPYLSKPDTGRTYSDDKFKGDLIIDPETWKKEGKPMVDAILKVAEMHFGKKLKITEFKSPLTIMGAGDDVPERFKNSIMLRAKSKFKPTGYGPNKVEGKFPELTPEQVAAIKGGDTLRLIVNLYGYSQSGGGIAAGLNGYQFIKVGDPMGQGKTRELSLLEDSGETEDVIETNDGGFGFSTE